MAVTAALVLGLVAAALLIWRRERLSARSAMRGPAQRWANPKRVRQRPLGVSEPHSGA